VRVENLDLAEEVLEEVVVVWMTRGSSGGTTVVSVDKLALMMMTTPYVKVRVEVVGVVGQHR
jgi:hypothetical protein